MSTIQLNSKDFASQTSSAEPVIASTVTGSPALAVTNTTGVLPVGVTGQHLCKAWVNFNGQTANPATMFDSLNVTSVTNHGTGRFTVNLTVTQPSINYTVVVTAGFDAGGVSPVGIVGIHGDCSTGNEVAPTTTAFFISTTQHAGTAKDFKYVSAMVFGD